MGFLKNIFKKNIDRQDKLKETKAIVPKEAGIEKDFGGLVIHEDLKDLIWIADGPKKNYVNDSKKEIYEANGIKITFSIMNGDEPSLIYLKLPVSLVEDVGHVERPPYYPRYSELTPEQKGVYWKLISNPYNSNIDVGFVFILYYGLERHLFKGDYERAFNVILKLRDYHSNKSFQVYSGNALILTCLMKQRADLALKFMKSLDKDYEYNFSDNLFVLCKYSLEIPMTARDIMRMSKSFEFTKGTYIKEYPEVFEETLCEVIKEKYSRTDILISEFITNTELKKVRNEPVGIFANMSIIEETIKVPLLIECFKFKKAIYDLLEASHEKVKIKLKKLRKSGEIEKKKASTPKAKTILVFDKEEESEILKQLKKSNKDPMERHFNLIRIQDFYYKYRDLDSTYIEKCIEYCNEDINSLQQMQRAYYENEIDSIRSLSTIYSKNEVEKRASEVGYFKGQIPAFKRLAIIYEKRREIESAISICIQAVKYYEGIEMHELVDEFNKRKVKLEGKFKV